MRWRFNQLNLTGTLPMGKGTLPLNTEKTVWAPEPVWTVWRRGNLLPHSGNRNTIPGLSSSYPTHNTNRATSDLLWSVTLNSYCPTDWRDTTSPLDPCILTVPSIGLKDHNISARLVYSYCPSIGLKNHNISTDSCIPTVHWTEGTQYFC